MTPIAKIELEKIPAQLVGKWVVLWDGDCGFCRRSIEWVKSQDTDNVLTMSKYQDHQAWLPAAVFKLSTQQVHLLSPNGEFWGGGEAARRVLDLVNYKSLATVLGLPLARFFTDWGYRLVARNRLFFSRYLFRK